MEPIDPDAFLREQALYAAAQIWQGTGTEHPQIIDCVLLDADKMVKWLKGES